MKRETVVDSRLLYIVGYYSPHSDYGAGRNLDAIFQSRPKPYEAILPDKSAAANNCPGADKCVFPHGAVMLYDGS